MKTLTKEMIEVIKVSEKGAALIQLKDQTDVRVWIYPELFKKFQSQKTLPKQIFEKLVVKEEWNREKDEVVRVLAKEVVKESEKAVLIHFGYVKELNSPSIDPTLTRKKGSYSIRKTTAWLPKSQVQIEKFEKNVGIDMPNWLVIEKGVDEFKLSEFIKDDSPASYS